MSYLCCPLTLGLSFLVPKQCVDDAEKALQHRINRINRAELHRRGIEMVFVRQFGTSWLELRLSKQESNCAADEDSQLL